MRISISVDVAAILYTLSAVLFILALRGLSSPESSRKGNVFGMLGIAIAIITTALSAGLWGLVAAFHSLVGLAAVLVAIAAFFSPESFGILSDNGIKPASLLELGLGAAIGAITFSGSVIAFAKLNGNMSGAPILLPFRHLINGALLVCIVTTIVMLMKTGGNNPNFIWVLLALTFLIGFLLIIPIGGADMPVVVSMLNSYSGWAAAALGFTLGNLALIITGALVGSSGAILSYIMCKAMNRSFVSVILGGFGADGASASDGDKEQRPVKRGSAEDAAFIMKNASKVIIVPGYGLAVALAEANVPYDEVFELEDINSEFSNADVAFVIGANDVTNPAAKTDPSSPIAGMPILDVDKASTVLFVKRSLSPGYAGIDNDLFYEDKTMMLLSDAKKLVEEVIKSL